jgi:transcriptional regulator with XRE-family HTH domain
MIRQDKNRHVKSKSTLHVMSDVQCRMARAALRLSVIALAEAAKVATGTIVRLEGGEALKPRTVEAIRLVFEARGIEFTNGGIPGVRLHPAKPRRKRS